MEKVFHGEGRTMPNFTGPDELASGRTTGREPTVQGERGPEEVAAGHIPGAVPIPVGELEARFGELPRDRPVVTYCNMYHPGSSRGERAAELLQGRGFAARALTWGYPAWLALNPEPDGNKGE